MPIESSPTESSQSKSNSQPAAFALELEGLSKVFKVGRAGKKITAVNNVSLNIARGEVLALVGESGSGKSTMARLIAHLHEPDAGTVKMDNAVIPNHLKGAGLKRFRKDVQMIFQDPYGSLNGLNSIGYILSRPIINQGLAKGAEVQTRVNELLERVGLAPGAEWAAKRPHQLSGGQRQRVVIARALATQPKLILADEPTSALDVSIRLDIMNLLLDLKDTEGLAMLFITHDLSGARYMADRVAVMYTGHIVEIGPTDKVIAAPQMPYTQLLRVAAPKPEESIRAEKVESRGEIPDLSNLPPGCPFEPRCPHARAACSVGLPKLYEVAPGHFARCILHDPALAAQPPIHPDTKSA